MSKAESEEERELRVAAEIAALSTDINTALRRLEKIERLLTVMAAMAKRWSGATFLLLGLGSIAVAPKKEKDRE